MSRSASSPERGPQVEKLPSRARWRTAANELVVVDPPTGGAVHRTLGHGRLAVDLLLFATVACPRAPYYRLGAIQLTFTSPQRFAGGRQAFNRLARDETGARNGRVTPGARGSLALIQTLLALVGGALAFVGGALAFVGGALAFVGGALAFVRDATTGVEP